MRRVRGRRLAIAEGEHAEDDRIAVAHDEDRSWLLAALDAREEVRAGGKRDFLRTGAGNAQLLAVEGDARLGTFNFDDEQAVGSLELERGGSGRGLRAGESFGEGDHREKLATRWAGRELHGVVLDESRIPLKRDAPKVARRRVSIAERGGMAFARVAVTSGGGADSWRYPCALHDFSLGQKEHSHGTRAERCADGGGCGCQSRSDQRRAGAHPLGTGLGAAAGGAAAGAAVGAAAGPVGTAVGIVAGAIAGGYAGKAVAEEIDPTVEGDYWRSEYPKRKYFDKQYDYDTMAPAYQLGWESRARHRDRTWDEVEPELREGWQRSDRQMAWDKARQASRDAWDRIESASANVRRGRARRSSPAS